MQSPLISVITVTYNASKTFEKTIRSVYDQNMPVEYIIIDGGSTDGTLDIAKRELRDTSILISEPDKGIYDAMNKGIEQASGDWLFFLGADDVLMPDIFIKVKDELDSSYAAIFGKVKFDTGTSMQSHLSPRILLQNTVHHQSVLYNKKLFTNFRYDISFKAIADYELNLKIWLEKLPYKQLPLVIALCSSQGTSSAFEISLNETNQVRRKYVKNFLVQKLLSITLWSYYAQKKLRGVSMVGSANKRR